MKRIAIIMIFVMLATGCSTVAVQYDNNSSINQTLSPDSLESSEFNSDNMEIIRAIGKSNKGQVLIVPEEDEKIEQLGAPSCLGEETDYSINGKYKILFKDSEGNITQISEYEGQIIAKDTEAIELEKLTFNGVELFHFKPIPNLCRPDIAYLFGVTEDKEAFQFSFEYDDNTFRWVCSSPNTIPEIIDNMLVISSWEWDKGNYKEFFVPDVQKRTMKFVKKEFEE